MITQTSGLACIAYWLTVHYKTLGTESEISKTSPVVARIKEWVDEQFDNGRHNVISATEMEEMFEKFGGIIK